MKIFLTGSTGFIGKNLLAHLEYVPQIQVFAATRNTSVDELKNELQKSDLIIHLAGESRSREDGDTFVNNVRYTEQLIKLADKHKRIIFSSTNKQNHPAYWQSKQKEEQLIRNHFLNYTIVRMDNVFGKWAKPFYNSVVATFLKGVIEAKPFKLFDELNPIDFLYIDDVIKQFIDLIMMPTTSSVLTWNGTYQMNAKQLLETIQSIHQDYIQGQYLQFKDPFKQRLALTYLTYLTPEKLTIPTREHPDERGNFIEISKGDLYGQTSINLIQPGFQKGNHFHHQRWEKFMILSGEGTIKLRQKFESKPLTFASKDLSLKMLTIPPGYVHQIENNGKEKMLVWMWSSLVYDPAKPDTYSEKV